MHEFYRSVTFCVDVVVVAVASGGKADDDDCDFYCCCFFSYFFLLSRWWRRRRKTRLRVVVRVRDRFWINVKVTVRNRGIGQTVRVLS